MTRLSSFRVFGSPQRRVREEVAKRSAHGRPHREEYQREQRRSTGDSQPRWGFEDFEPRWWPAQE